MHVVLTHATLSGEVTREKLLTLWLAPRRAAGKEHPDTQVCLFILKDFSVWEGDAGSEFLLSAD